MTDDIRASTLSRAIAGSRAARGLLLAFFALLVSTAGAGAAAAAEPLPGGRGGDWQLPLSGSAEVLRPFDPPAEEWSAGHRGVDLAGRVGSHVLAAGAGVVAYAGRVAGRGVVTVRHGELRTTYQPVRATVRRGQSVAAGDRIGVLTADPHCGRHGCLHWGLLRDETYLDPMALFRAAPARLVPVWGVSPGAPASASPTVGYPSAGPVSRPAGAHRPPTARGGSDPPGTPASSRASTAGAAAATAATAAIAAAGLAVQRRVRPGRGPRSRSPG